LGDPKLRRGLGEVQGFAYGQEISQMPEFHSLSFIAFPEADKFAGFLSVSEGISGLISKCGLEFSHDFTPTPPSTLSSGLSAVP
jgi:hypothetical protein